MLGGPCSEKSVSGSTAATNEQTTEAEAEEAATEYRVVWQQEDLRSEWLAAAELKERLEAAGEGDEWSNKVEAMIETTTRDKELTPRS